MTWILTNSATDFDLLNPAAAKVATTDIAHALSLVCRFNGHCAFHYSVAQHSLLVVSILQHQGRPAEELLAGLLHDAAEAYIADLTRPLKLLLIEAAAQRNEAWLAVLTDAGLDPKDAALKAAIYQLFPDEQGQGLSVLVDVYRQIEHRVWMAICERFHLPPDLPASVKQADMIALATEKRSLLPDHPAPWPCLEGIEPMPFRIERRHPEQIRELFHNRLLELLAITHRNRSAAELEHALIHGTGTGSPLGLMRHAEEHQA